MKKSAIIVAVVLMALLARPGIALAQVTPAPIKGSWDGLKAVPPGDELVVNLRNGQSLKGRLRGVSDTVLTITRGKTATDLNRGDVLKVHRLISRSTKRSTMMGLGIGAGVGGVTGGVWGASASGGTDELGLPILIFAAGGAIIGTLTGFLIGSRKHRVLIYETT